ncbi:MAG: hypothetical protein KGH89_06830 [Thaumarchaeota archaeon]|nr:hypothetical protein [Nitrososphaerota archaeon]
MGKVEITNELKGSLGECYYKEYCAQRGWAYTSLEQIYKNKIQNDRLEFKFGFERIMVKIPSELRNEIQSLAVPSNNSEANPSFVYDFLACKAYESDNPRILDDVKAEDFKWVEVKTGKSRLTQNQYGNSKNVTIPLLICRIPNVTDSPEDVEIFWNTVRQDYEMLDEMDDSQW